MERFVHPLLSLDLHVFRELFWFVHLIPSVSGMAAWFVMRELEVDIGIPAPEQVVGRASSPVVAEKG